MFSFLRPFYRTENTPVYKSHSSSPNPFSDMKHFKALQNQRIIVIIKAPPIPYCTTHLFPPIKNSIIKFIQKSSQNFCQLIIFTIFISRFFFFKSSLNLLKTPILYHLFYLSCSPKSLLYLSPILQICLKFLL